jgi:hypothetical protein
VDDGHYLGVLGSLTDFAPWKCVEVHTTLQALRDPFAH